MKIDFISQENLIRNMDMETFFKRAADPNDLELYDEIIKEEDFMRNNMYKPEFEDHPMNKNPYYNLIILNNSILKKLVPGRSEDPNLLMSRYSKTNVYNGDEELRRRCVEVGYADPDSNEVWRWIEEVRKRNYPVLETLDKVKHIVKVPNKVIIAGGSILHHIFGTPHHDVDLFIWGLDRTDAMSKVNQIDKNMGRGHTYTRTANCITIHKEKDIQIILRLYRTPSEVVHGFDVDSCCMGYDTKVGYFMTKRAWYSIVRGYNTVNFDRLSPSYEHRLVKYAVRGIPIKVPNFDRGKVDIKALEARWKEHRDLPTWNVNRKYSVLFRDLRGLDIILMSEYKYHRDNLSPTVLSQFEKLSHKVSDYCINISSAKSYVTDIINHLLYTSDLYPEHSKKYMPIIRKFPRHPEYEGCVNQIFSEKEIIRYSSRTLYDVVNMDTRIYDLLQIIKPWAFPLDLQFKTTNPGEQMTNTFNRIVLCDNRIWYHRHFYTGGYVNDYEKVMSALKSLPPGHIPGFSGGDEYHASESRWRKRE